MTRRRGTSGNVSRELATRRYRLGSDPVGSDPAPAWLGFSKKGSSSEPGPRRDLQAARAEVLDRLVPAGGASPRDESGAEDDAMDEHRHEQELDVLGNHVRPSVEQRPRAGRALEREAPAHGAADHDRLLLARGAYEVHDPAVEHVVDVDVLGR